MKILNRFLFALSFLTRIPVPFNIKYNREISGKSMFFYPLIGIIIGMTAAAADFFLLSYFPSSVRNVLLLIFLIYLSGGLHLDGFMDTMDGIGSGRKKEKILEIMHDSQVGAFGVIGFVLLILLKFNLLLNLNSPVIYRISFLILMPAWSRFMMVVVMKTFPPAASSRLGKDFKAALGKMEVVGAGLWIFLLMLFLNFILDFPLFYMALIGFLALSFTFIFGYYIYHKIEGITGDISGAINEMVEVLILLIGVLIIN